jgi:phosphoribosylaminoimidazolecarboxamide formyltransferase/IMP cyclohydrolase
MSINTVNRIDDRVAVRHVLISLSDKTGLDGLVRGLIAACPGVRLYSTGGTFTAIQQLLGVDSARHLTSVSDYTGQPEMQGGLVKTLDFKIYLGLLSETYNEAHKADMARCQAQPIDAVIVNLYPFESTVARPGCTPEQARGNIDIGGPCMLRAAAKNYIRVACVTDPADYAAFSAELKAGGGRVGLKTRFALARKAFAHVADYDRAISSYLNGLTFEQAAAAYTLENR